MLVQECRLARRHQFAVFGLDLFRARLRHDVGTGFSEHRRTANPQILFGSAVDQQISQIGNALHDDRRRHVFDDPAEERSCALKLALGQISFGNVFMRRHPAAALHRLVYDRDRAAVLQLDGEGKSLAPLERLAQVRFITLRVERECSRSDARFKQIAHGASPPDAVRVDPVHLPVSLVPDNQAILRIKHAQTLMHVVESFVEPKMLLAAVAANLPTEYRCQQCKECRGDEHRLRG